MVDVLLFIGDYADGDIRLKFNIKGINNSFYDIMVDLCFVYACYNSMELLDSYICFDCHPNDVPSLLMALVIFGINVVVCR